MQWISDVVVSNQKDITFYYNDGTIAAELKNGIKKIEDISNMFSNCSGLKSINLKSFNATYAKTEGMFFGCKKL